MNFEDVYKMQSALQVATNTLSRMHKNAKSEEDARMAEKALTFIKEKTAMVPNDGSPPQSHIMYDQE